MTTLPILSVRNISKMFPGGVVALSKVSIDLYPGEFVALLGENGAGKSTLVKILYGIYSPDEGAIEVNRKRVVIGNPSDAIKMGIIMVSQIPQLIDRLTVAENISLSLSKLGLLSGFGDVVKAVREASQKVGVNVDPRSKVWTLTYTQKQLVEILRALLLGARVLILDEALTYLPVEERRRFYKYLKEFKERGGTVVIITHKIPEALEVADRIYVLRRGELAGMLRREEATLDNVRALMFGEYVKEITYERFSLGQRQYGKNVIEISQISVEGDFGEIAVKGVTLNVRTGEIAGIAGVVGNGQRELLEAVAGLRKVLSGKIVIDGVDVTNKGISLMRKLKVGFIPDIPLKYGASSDNTILENVALIFANNGLLINWDNIRSTCQEIIKTFNVLTSSENSPVKILSGGNIMKVVVGKEILYSEKALIAYNPTRALDEVTSIFVRRLLWESSMRRGMAILFASEDLDEVIQLSDTIYVMNSGKLYGPFDPLKTPREEIEKLMVT